MQVSRLGDLARKKNRVRSNALWIVVCWSILKSGPFGQDQHKQKRAEKELKLKIAYGMIDRIVEARDRLLLGQVVHEWYLAVKGEKVVR
jgi:hypothetical protein